MKKLIIALVIAPLCGAFLCASAYAQKTKAQLSTEIGTTYPDNTSGQITPAGVRTYETDLINSIMPTAPVVAGNTACFNGTTGLLQDCGVAPSTLIIGMTQINSGTSSRVLFDNAGVLGEYPVNAAGGIVGFNGALGTPTSGTATNITGLPISTGVSGLGSGVATFLGAPSSANLRAALTDETGTGLAYFQGGALGTPASGVATNLTGLPLTTGVTGNLPLANIATGTQDTLLGYFGSTSASAVAPGNCSNALTYSTTTHTFGCNTSAGTGTVTSVATAGLASGGPITSSGTVTVTAASKSDQQTGTSNVVAVAPLHQQDHDSAAKAWVNFSGSGTNGAQTINSSYNVSAVTRTATGNYAVTIGPTPFANTSYVCHVNARIGGVNGWGQATSSGLTATNVPVNFITISAGSLAAFDPVNGEVVCYGRQ